MLGDTEQQPDDNWICKWPDGTRCWLRDLEEYLLFMDDSYEVVAVSDYDLPAYGLM